MARKGIAAVLAAAAVLVSSAGAGKSVVADPVRTPGVRNPAVTQTKIKKTICVAGWTKTIRPKTSYTGPLEIKQMREYGLKGSPDDFEEDHLISLSLGGHPTSPKNLWPEPIARARKVDVIERRLHTAVCTGKMRLRAAQKEIARVKHEAG
ncbi:MAG TPA: hypothetical protein VGJ77_16025 [Gaiellaceae bacterium]|jgi:hypothetical protein